MPTLLIGWELGAGNGHLHRLVPIIDWYLRRGWNIVAAVRARAAAEALFAPFRCFPEGSLSIIQAPIFLHRVQGAGTTSSLAELMARIGFADPTLLRPVVSAWQRIVAEARPDAVISDMAPSLNIALRGTLPNAVIGNGWTIPPDTTNPISFVSRPGAQLSAIDASDRILETVARVAGGTYFERFCDLLRGSANFVCTLEMLDPYKEHRSEGYYWPFEIPSQAAAPAQEPDQGFIYLPKDHPVLGAVVSAIESGTLAFRGYFSGEEFKRPNLHASSSPLDLSAELPRSRIAVHHGGLATAIQCIVHCVPQIISALDWEKRVIASGVEAAGHGMAIPPNADAKSLAHAIDYAATLTPKTQPYCRMKTVSPRQTLSVLGAVVG